MAAAMEIKDWLGSADNVTATLVASYLISQGVRWAYTRTIGSRRAFTAKLNELACGNPVDKVESAFGPSVFRDVSTGNFRWGPSGLVEAEMEQRVYASKYGWLTVYFIEDAVVAYAFTLRHGRFLYDLNLQSFGQLRGALGRTSFNELCAQQPESGELFVGASLAGYTEVHSFGRPGRYQSYALSSTMIGWSKHDGVYADIGSAVWGTFSADDGNFKIFTDKWPKIEQYRRAAAPDTFAVFAGLLNYRQRSGPLASGAIDHDRLLLLNKSNRHREERWKARRWKIWKWLM
jgi:hypothetical protein